MITKKRLLPIILSSIFAVLISWIIAVCLTTSPQYPILSLDEGFAVTINQRHYSGVSFSEFYKVIGDKLKRGDNITARTTLPDMGDVPFPVLLFRSRYTTVRCYIDGELIYEYGQDMYQKSKFVGKMYHFITLPHGYEGKELLLAMTVAENNPFTALSPIKMGSQPDIEGEFIHEHMMIIATGMFLIIFGMSFLCIALFFVAMVPDIMSFLIGSLMCLNLGAWIMTYYNVLSPFVYTPYETQIEYFTLYLIVPYCYLMVYFVQKIEKKRLFMTAAAITFLLTFLQYLLHYVFNIHLRSTLPIYHIVGLLGFVLISYYVIRNLRKNDVSASGKMQMAGLVAFCVAEVAHLIIYVLDSMHVKTNHFVNIVIIDSGCLIFVMCQLANYMLYISEAFAQRQEHASLTHLAYADGLTNMANRARADKAMADLNKTQDDYCIVSVDLNGLKIVNDKFGHPAGDKYIKDFSKVLTTSFSEEGFCARIGGDEFLVILKDTTEKETETLIGRMVSALNVMNALYTDYHRSVATGYAFRHEVPEASSHEIYLLADQRMYENKRKMHEELGIHARL
jgi:diguanylate cyclase (GGDEF)-like protein